jgi:NAD(P)H-dependent FMN reductase
VSICGSLRKGSYNRLIMNALPGFAPLGMRICGSAVISRLSAL